MKPNCTCRCSRRFKRRLSIRNKVKVGCSSSSSTDCNKYKVKDAHDHVYSIHPPVAMATNNNSHRQSSHYHSLILTNEATAAASSDLHYIAHSQRSQGQGQLGQCNRGYCGDANRSRRDSTDTQETSLSSMTSSSTSSSPSKRTFTLTRSPRTSTVATLPLSKAVVRVTAAVGSEEDNYRKPLELNSEIQLPAAVVVSQLGLQQDVVTVNEGCYGYNSGSSMVHF